MNKILILLSLIYLISCKLACSSFEKQPENREDCYNRALENGDDGICCFLNYSSPFFGNYSKCEELDTKTNIEFMKQVLNATYSKNNVTIDVFSCPTKEKSDDSSKKMILLAKIVLVQWMKKAIKIVLEKLLKMKQTIIVVLH